MVATKRGKSRSVGSKSPAPVKHRHKPAPDVVSMPPAEGDTVEPVEPPVFEIGVVKDARAAEGAMDDLAGMDTVADMVDEPAEARRRR